jgi:hypothetical protein
MLLSLIVWGRVYDVCWHIELGARGPINHGQGWCSSAREWEGVTQNDWTWDHGRHPLPPRPFTKFIPMVSDVRVLLGTQEASLVLLDEEALRLKDNLDTLAVRREPLSDAVTALAEFLRCLIDIV